MEIYFAVIIFIVLDIITGLAKALKNNAVNSSVLRVGFWHKSAEIMAIGGATAIEYYKSFLGLSDISILIPLGIPGNIGINDPITNPIISMMSFVVN